jgi:hypothetical protein
MPLTKFIHTASVILNGEKRHFVHLKLPSLWQHSDAGFNLTDLSEVKMFSSDKRASLLL